MSDKINILSPIFEQIKKLNSLSWIKLIAYITTIPLFLIFLHCLLLSVIIPMDFPRHLIQLSYENITISGLFFSNYFHSVESFDHIYSNYISTIVFLAILGFISLIVIPAYNLKIPKYFCELNLISILIFCPFFVSLVSIYFWEPMSNIRWSLGFSGITYAILGLDFFLFLAIYWKIGIRLVKSSEYTNSEFMILSLFIVLIICPFWIFFYEIGGTINPYGHMAGYSFGLIIPVITFLVHSLVQYITKRFH